jgi:hypothetical protein
VAVTVRPQGGATSLPSGIGDVWSYWIDREFGTTTIKRVRAHFELETPLKEDYLAVRRRSVPSWSNVFDPPRPFPYRYLYCEDARGWPMCALRLETEVRSWSVTPANVETHNGIVLWENPAYAVDRIALPLRPIWSGFIVDTLLFGVVAFVLLFGPGMLRRQARRRTGRCECCGYDLRGNTNDQCPECGHVMVHSAGKPAG